MLTKKEFFLWMKECRSRPGVQLCEIHDHRYAVRLEYNEPSLLFYNKKGYICSLSIGAKHTTIMASSTQVLWAQIKAWFTESPPTKVHGFQKAYKRVRKQRRGRCLGRGE